MSKSGWDEFAEIALGIIGGIALAQLLKNLLQQKCPYCNNVNESSRQHCKFCGGKLK